MKKTIVVTGASGYIGWNICRKLVDEGFNVIAVVRNEKSVERLQYIGVDVKYYEVCQKNQEMFFLKHADVVIHAAAKLGRGEWKEIEEANIIFTQQIIQQCKRYGVPKIIFFSTIEVYDFSKKLALEEDAITMCGQFYTDSKILAEKIILQNTEHTELKYYILRVGMVYGPGSEFWVTRIINEMKTGGVELIGDGKGSIYPVYIGNLVQYVLWICRNDKDKSDIINVVDFNGMNWEEWLINIKSYFVPEGKIVYRNKTLCQIKLAIQRYIFKRPYSKKVDIYNRWTEVCNAKYISCFEENKIDFIEYDVALKRTLKWIKEKEKIGFFYET